MASIYPFHFRFPYSFCFCLLLFLQTFTGSDSNSSFNATTPKSANGNASVSVASSTGAGPVGRGLLSPHKPSYQSWDQAIDLYKRIFFGQIPWTAGIGAGAGILLIGIHSYITKLRYLVLILACFASIDGVNYTSG